ncbi:LysE family translocator [Elizabethkingia meningoseptica]|uniref:LysE family translocator n=1 Tax=Elizabethkingia meningoseptica TaxID=238 RepID=UPI000332C343|nr:LysE family translocator [Elizabethkingia meningoseptica]AQX05830.1 lysine transporter LysE [Elizabethkingia meningoseptica]AQX47874.1 lysine transporter LysE [Elizabethkingia meningoseptica]EJK5327741.1 LysE family translocator [Elizabethkingia meningoseptica]EOR29953.1 lysine exporter protein LysE/YggA [Elizabethkingia meningoseptica ATCC 13253 = NBRC 12535]KUY23063.1 lysine transporter LysE [Elizabethkingia meningoseptica]
MIPIHELLFFILAAFILVISPGPNMIYLISRTITQGRKAGLTSLGGVICGFLFHIVMVSFGLTAVLFAVPYAYIVLKTLGTLYLLYLAYQAVKPNSKNIFEVDRNITTDRPGKLFTIGFLTNVLNPKVAVFYLSFFPQFIKPQYGSVLTQSLELGVIQVLVSFSINFIIVLTAAKAARFFAQNPTWIKVQKWFMASVLTFLAVKMALSKVK